MAVEDGNASVVVEEPCYLLKELDHNRLCTVREILNLLSLLTSCRSDGVAVSPHEWAGCMNLLSDEMEDALSQGWWQRVPDDDDDEDGEGDYERL